MLSRGCSVGKLRFPQLKDPAVRALITFSGLLAAGPTAALPGHHSPFFPAEDYAISTATCAPAVREIEASHPAVGMVRFDAEDGYSLVLRMASSMEDLDYRERYVARIERNGDAVTSEVDLPLVASVAGLLPTIAICADVNSDGVIDFITDHSNHGNGLGAAFYSRLIIVSSGLRSFRFWRAQTMWPSRDDYVSFGNIESFVMVTTSYANSGGPIPHSYLVYSLWTFRGGEIVSANEIDDRFPKWVWMTYRENHKPASSLSNEDKRSMAIGPIIEEILPH